LGVFISGFRDTTRGAAPICMCHAVAARRHEVARFDSLLLSVLSKPAPTSSPKHTQADFRGRDLHVRHCHRLSIALGKAVEDGFVALQVKSISVLSPDSALKLDCTAMASSEQRCVTDLLQAHFPGEDPLARG
jgi:hypothetical protein